MDGRLIIETHFTPTNNPQGVIQMGLRRLPFTLLKDYTISEILPFFRTIMAFPVSGRLQSLLLKKPDPIPKDSNDNRWKWFKGCLGALDGTHIGVQVPAQKKGRQHGLRVPQGNYYLVDAGCTRDVRSKYKDKVSNWYDDFEATAKWKLGIQKKEARKVQREAKNTGDASVYRKRKEPPQVDPNSTAPPIKSKKQKAKEVKQGRKKWWLASGSGDDKGWKPTPSDNRSSDTKNDEEDNVPVDKTRARLYKKLKRKQRTNVVPEAKADYNQNKLEDYDIRGQTVEVNEKELMEWLSVKAPMSKDTTFTGDEMDKILVEGGTTEDEKEPPKKSEAHKEKIPKTKREASPPPSAPPGSSTGLGDVGKELGDLFGTVLNDALGVLKAELESVIETQGA
ncbi:hypothetical protein K1719_019099 [Acacia pycnantha]|nr:hypothetical protein K1719_019099 [Acacia pycnantha]